MSTNTCTQQPKVTTSTALTFKPGALFSIKLSEQGDSKCVVTIENGAALKFDTATCFRPLGGEHISISTDENPVRMPICIFGDQKTVTNLGMEISGPRKITLKAKGNVMNLFGTVSRSTDAAVDRNDDDMPAVPIVSDNSIANTVTSTSNKNSPEATKSNTEETGRSKRKLADAREDVETVTADETAVITPANTAREKKKARKKLAKLKEKELRDAIAKQHEQADEQKDPKSSKKDKQKDKQSNNTSEEEESTEKEFVKKEALTQRRVNGGIIVKDIIIGGGPLVKSGRRVSILYEGKLTDGTVFDRKKNRTSPLMFRQGTGQVIRGLERGLDGMRTGGEREIIIPPALGYGEKGSGPIPGDATLVFTVYLQSVRGK